MQAGHGNCHFIPEPIEMPQPAKMGFDKRSCFSLMRSDNVENGLRSSVHSDGFIPLFEKIWRPQHVDGKGGA